MDEPTPPTSGGFPLSPGTVAAASSWRSTATGLACIQDPGLDRSSARRSAAFVAHMVGALERTQRRWF